VSNKISARVVSVVLHPAILQGLYIFLPIEMPRPNILIILQVLGLAALLPVVISGIYLKWAQVEDIFTIPRENRMIPFGISIFCLGLTWYLFQDIYPWLSERIIWVLLLNSVAFFVTQWEKLSLHVYALCALTVLWIPYWMACLIFLLPMVLWARIRLKAHSTWQLWLGALMGVSTAVLIQLWENIQ
jgi:hypothetical protein